MSPLLATFSPARVTLNKGLLVAIGATLVATGCGGPTIQKAPDEGPGHDLACPAGTELHGKAPPNGKILFCADLRRSGIASRHGPVVDWSCRQCRKGAYEKGRYNHGRRDGEWQLFASDGLRMAISHYREGKKVGDWAGWYSDGAPRYHRSFDSEGKPHRTEWQNYRNGQREFEGRWVNGQRDGRWQRWTRRGHRISDGTHKAGRRHGPWKTFDSQGREAGVTFYERGKVVREGVVVGGVLRLVMVDDKGNRTGTLTEKDGKRHGQMVEFHRGTETPWRKTTWVAGKQTGPASLHRKNGTKRAAGRLVDGKPTCGWQLFDDKGTDLTRGPAFAAIVSKQAGAAVDNKDPCAWTDADIMLLRAAADAPATVALARWMLEHAARKGRDSDAEASGPPEGPVTAKQRLEAMVGLHKKAEEAAAKLAFDVAALHQMAALLEADRAFAGELLVLPADANAPGSPSWPGPKPDKDEARAFMQSAVDQLPGIRALLYEKQAGERPIRKAGRVTLGRIGLSKLNYRKFKARITKAAKKMGVERKATDVTGSTASK